MGCSSGEDGVLYAGCSEAFLGLGKAATAIKMARRAVALQPLSAKVVITMIPRIAICPAFWT